MNNIEQRVSLNHLGSAKVHTGLQTFLKLENFYQRTNFYYIKKKF